MWLEESLRLCQNFLFFWSKHIAGLEYGYWLGLRFLSYAEIGSRSLSPAMCLSHKSDATMVLFLHLFCRDGMEADEIKGQLDKINALEREHLRLTATQTLAEVQ